MLSYCYESCSYSHTLTYVDGPSFVVVAILVGVVVRGFAYALLLKICCGFVVDKSNAIVIALSADLYYNSH